MGVKSYSYISIEDNDGNTYNGIDNNNNSVPESQDDPGRSEVHFSTFNETLKMTKILTY